jgi:predicted homoserine dehydrogenase-like protein
MTIFRRLRKCEAEGRLINVAIVGAGLIGRGIVRQTELTPAMRVALLVVRQPHKGVEAYVRAGRKPSEILVSDHARELQHAVRFNRPAVTTNLEMIRDLEGIDVTVEVTGAVEYGAQMALYAIESGKHVVMMNSETDATVGCALKRLADEAGVVYTNSDGDQPGVLKRLVDWVAGTGFEIVAAVNCKGFMDINATPDSIREWAIKQNTSLAMTTAFTDGTKMNIENAVLANATGLIPEVRGMHGVKTNIPTALQDCLNTFKGRGIVDYTLGGNFGGGVFVIGHAEERVMVQPLMKYFKMGDGPNYLFYRPYHLCHLETPLTIAEAALDGEPTIAPLGAPVVEVMAIAKRDLNPGDVLDGIGGYCVYGQIDTADRARGVLAVGLADRARVIGTIRRGEPIPLSKVEIDQESVLMRLRAQQDNSFVAPDSSKLVPSSRCIWRRAHQRREADGADANASS